MNIRAETLWLPQSSGTIIFYFTYYSVNHISLLPTARQLVNLLTHLTGLKASIFVDYWYATLLCRRWASYILWRHISAGMFHWVNLQTLFILIALTRSLQRTIRKLLYNPSKDPFFNRNLTNRKSGTHWKTEGFLKHRCHRLNLTVNGGLKTLPSCETVVHPLPQRKGLLQLTKRGLGLRQS